MSVPFEKELENVARDVTKVAQRSGEDCYGRTASVLRQYLLPLLQAGQAMRDHYLETEFWPEESKKEAAAWDAARERLAQLEKR